MVGTLGTLRGLRRHVAWLAVAGAVSLGTAYCGTAGKTSSISTTSTRGDPTSPASTTVPAPAPLALSVTTVELGTDGLSLRLLSPASIPAHPSWLGRPYATANVVDREIRVSLIVNWERLGPGMGVAAPISSTSASVTLAEPFDGRVVVDATSGARFPLTQTGLVDLEPLLAGWHHRSDTIGYFHAGGGLTWTRTYGPDQARSGALASDITVVHFIDADAPPAATYPGDESVPVDVDGVSGMLVRGPLLGSPAAPASLSLAWRPGRHGLVLIVSGNPAPLSEQQMLGLASAMSTQVR